MFLQRIYRNILASQQYYTNDSIRSRSLSDVLTGLSIFAPNKCQTQFPFGKILLSGCMQLAIMRLKDATFASRREAAFHAFLKNLETRVET